MTCEISIMNLNAIVLAADSAMTVTRWENGKEQTRFFKGSNKIFQLSNHHPIGLMIFDSANMEEVPWELIVKEFRTYIKDRSFNELEGYAAELFNFVESNLQVFPLPYRETIFKNNVNAVVATYLYQARQQDAVKKAQNDADKRAALDTYFHTFITDIDAYPCQPILRKRSSNSRLTPIKQCSKRKRQKVLMNLISLD